jgi:hypothetical protein
MLYDLTVGIDKIKLHSTKLGTLSAVGRPAETML